MTTISGVQDATVSRYSVPLGPSTQASVFYVEHTLSGAADFNVVGPHYFSTLGIPPLAGRQFTGRK